MVITEKEHIAVGAEKQAAHVIKMLSVSVCNEFNKTCISTRIADMSK